MVSDPEWAPPSHGAVTPLVGLGSGTLPPVTGGGTPGCRAASGGFPGSGYVLLTPFPAARMETESNILFPCF